MFGDILSKEPYLEEPSEKVQAGSFIFLWPEHFTASSQEIIAGCFEILLETVRILGDWLR